MSRESAHHLAGFAVAIVTAVIAIGADSVVSAKRTTPAALVPTGELHAGERLPASVESDLARRHVWMEVTAYCPCVECCGSSASGVTASGLPVTYNQSRFVAADTSVLPFGSKIRIPGYHADATVPVIDRGGAIKGSRIDVYFPTHAQAIEWGRKWLLVTVIQ